jgi:hypothetical protein
LIGDTILGVSSNAKMLMNKSPWRVQEEVLSLEQQRGVESKETDMPTTPISRVRSVTDTSITFMIPIPPTIRETDAIAISRTVRVLLASSCA